MNLAEKTDRELLEQLVSGQTALQDKMDFIAKRTDERFGAVIKRMDKGFAQNDADHRAMKKTLSEHTGNEAELGKKYQKLNEERLTMIHRQDRLEKLRR